jgi:DNA modification methylase
MKLLLGDCLDKLKELDDNSIDHIITDWPFYGVEREEEYFKIAEARIEYERNKPIILETPTGKKVEVKKEVEEKVNQFFG